MRTLFDEILRLPLIENFITAPDLGGVYFFISKNEVIYIGQTANFRKRFTKHIHLIKLINPDIRYLVIDDNKLRTNIENKFIREFTPYLNYNYHKIHVLKIDLLMELLKRGYTLSAITFDNKKYFLKFELC